MKNLLLLILALNLTTLSASESKPSSKYTSIDILDCLTVINSEEIADAEIDFYKGFCPSFGGYEVEISGGDIRYDLKLHYNGKDLAIDDQVSGFRDMGSSKIEWRYQVNNDGDVLFGGDVKFTALIYRINFQTYNDETEKEYNESRLVVVRLDGAKSCVIGRVDASKYKNSNEPNKVATKIADDLTQTCK